MGTAKAYLKANVTKASTFAWFATFVSLVAALDYVWNTYFAVTRGREPLVWALTVALALFIFFALLNYCWFAQSLLQDEIDRITLVKARLENQILSRRISSNKGKNR